MNATEMPTRNTKSCTTMKSIVTLIEKKKENIIKGKMTGKMTAKLKFSLSLSIVDVKV